MQTQGGNWWNKAYFIFYFLFSLSNSPFLHCQVEDYVCVLLKKMQDRFNESIS